MDLQDRRDLIGTSRVRRAPGRTVALIGAGVVAGAVLAGLATAAAAPSPTPAGGAGVAAAAPSHPAGGPDRRDHGHGAWSRVLHGTAVVDKRDGGGTETIAVQRGELTAASPSSVTVRSTDGFTATYALNAETAVRVDGAISSVAALTPGEQVRVEGVVVGAATTARHIAQGREGGWARHGLDRHKKHHRPGPDGKGPSARGPAAAATTSASPTPTPTPTR